MLIRKIKQEDIKVCGVILKKAYSQSPYNENFLNWNEERYIESKFKYCKDSSFVIEEDTKVIWFSFASVSYWTSGLQWILEEIVIDPDYQWKWFGKAIYRETEKYLRDLWAKSLMLWVLKSAKAVNFHINNGFFDPEEHSVMFKNLKSEEI